MIVWDRLQVNAVALLPLFWASYLLGRTCAPLEPPIGMLAPDIEVGMLTAKTRDLG